MKTYKGIAQIGNNILHVEYYFTEEDTIYCTVKAENDNFKVGEEFFTHYKSLIA